MKAPNEFSQIPGGGQVLLSSHSSISWQCIPKIGNKITPKTITKFLAGKRLVKAWFWCCLPKIKTVTTPAPSVVLFVTYLY